MATQPNDEWEILPPVESSSVGSDDEWEILPPPSDVPFIGKQKGSVAVAPEQTQSVFSRRLEEAQGARPGLDPENEFGGPRFFENGLPNPLSTVRDIADLAARGFEYSEAAGNTALEYLDEASKATGLADLLALPTGEKFLPGSAIGALGEWGGAGLPIIPKGSVHTPQGKPSSFVQQLFDERGVDTTPDIDPVARQAQTNEYRSTIQSMIDEGKTPSQIRHYVQSQGVDPSLVTGIDEAVAAKAAGQRTGVSVLDDSGPVSNAERAPTFAPIDEALEAEAAAFRPKADPTVDDLFPTEEMLKAREAEMEGRLASEAEAFRARKTEEPETARFESDEDLPENVQSIVDHVNTLTDKWENSPDTAVYDHFDGFDGVDPNSLGVYNPEDGLVYLNAKAIDREAEFRGLTQQEMTNTVMFHEGLGHFGLAQKFRDDLDGTLTNWYDNSAWFKNKTDKWIENNPDTYADDANPLVRASEEVLAELSEKGQLPKKLLDIIKNQIKDYARKAGIKLDFSAREIRTILAQAHEAVISGKGADVRGNGYRSMKSTYGESEGSLQGRAGREDQEGPTSPIHKVRSNRQIDEILEGADVEKTKETWGEWKDDADRIKMTTRMAEQLASGTTPAELLAAEKHAAKLANTISDLSHKAANQTLSPKEAALLSQHNRALDKTAQAISDVVANAARLLGSRKIEVATDETVAARLVRNMSASQIADLATPEGARKFAVQVTRSQRKAKLIEEAVRTWGNIMGFTRSLWSSYDLSAPFRQARALAHTGDFWKNMPNMLKYWGDEGFYNMTMDDIKKRPSYKAMERSGLAFTELGADLTKREEAFMSTWAEKIPGVKASERAYNGYLNKLRADLFDTMYQKLDDAGVDFDKNPKALKDLSHFLNNASGRGNLDLGKFAPTVAGILWSPRLMASRMQMLNPLYYAKLSPGVRAQAVKSAAAFAVTSVMFAKLAQTAGLDVEWDPRSSDFMKLKTGDTRYDMLGGFGQYVTLYSRLITNERKNAKGDVVEMGERFGSKDALDTIKDFVRSKFSPNTSLIVDARLGKNVVGEEFDPKTETVRRFVPLIMQDFYEQMKADGIVTGAVKAAPAIVGVGSQTYPGPTGSDIYGRSYEPDRSEDTPEIAEVKRLQEGSERTVLGPPGKSLTFDGERQTLTDEEFGAYQELSGRWIMEALAEDMQTAEWQEASDEDRIEWIREIANEARRDAREELFSTQEGAEEPRPWGDFEE